MGAALRLSSEIPENSEFFWSPIEEAARDDNIASLEEALVAEAYGREFAVGNTMTNEQILNLALGARRHSPRSSFHLARSFVNDGAAPS
jgi:hypothetical protein